MKSADKILVIGLVSASPALLRQWCACGDLLVNHACIPQPGGRVRS